MKNLLVVDDEQSIRALYGIVLSRCSHPVNIDYSENGEEALKAALNSSHDLIISDICMPVMDGISFHKLLKEQDVCKAKKFAFISGNIFSDNRSYIIDENIPYLEKPFKPNELVRFVDEVLIDLYQGIYATEFASDMRSFGRANRSGECIIMPNIPEESFSSPVTGKAFDYSEGGGIGFIYEGSKLPKGKVVKVIIDTTNMIDRDAEVVWTSVYEESFFRSGLQWVS